MNNMQPRDFEPLDLLRVNKQRDGNHPPCEENTPNRILGPSSIVYLNHALTFEWCVVSLYPRKEPNKTCILESLD